MGRGTPGTLSLAASRVFRWSFDVPRLPWHLLLWHLMLLYLLLWHLLLLHLELWTRHHRGRTFGEKWTISSTNATVCLEE